MICVLLKYEIIIWLQSIWAVDFISYYCVLTSLMTRSRLCIPVLTAPPLVWKPLIKYKNSEIVLDARRAPITVEKCSPHGVYELNSTLLLLYCLFSDSFYNPLNLFDIHIQKVTSLKQLYFNSFRSEKPLSSVEMVCKINNFAHKRKSPLISKG